MKFYLKIITFVTFAILIILIIFITFITVQTLVGSIFFTKILIPFQNFLMSFSEFLSSLLEIVDSFWKSFWESLEELFSYFLKVFDSWLDSFWTFLELELSRLFIIGTIIKIISLIIILFIGIASRAILFIIGISILYIFTEKCNGILISVYFIVLCFCVIILRFLLEFSAIYLREILIIVSTFAILMTFVFILAIFYKTLKKYYIGSGENIDKASLYIFKILINLPLFLSLPFFFLGNMYTVSSFYLEREPFFFLSNFYSSSNSYFRHASNIISIIRS